MISTTPTYYSSEPLTFWIHNHPTIVKTLEVASYVFGALLIANTAPMLSAVTAISEAVFALAFYTASVYLDLFIPPTHDMANHVYTPSECEGGRLYYEGDVPILSLDSDSPYTAGKAQGYLCGDAISNLSSKYLHILGGVFNDQAIRAFRERIPREYLQEIEGLVDGYNAWSQEQGFGSSARYLTVDQMIIFQMLPDLQQLESTQSVWGPNTRLGCSVFFERNAEGNIVFARNLDFPSLGVLGTHSLMIKRNYTDGRHSTLDLGNPALVGVLTGMNDQGLCLSMNVSSTIYARTDPTCLSSSFYNRRLLERSASVSNVTTHARAESPMSAYHLSASDRTGAAAVHFFQNAGGTHHIRNFEDGCSQSGCMRVLNGTYSSTTTTGDIRDSTITPFLENRVNRPIEAILAEPYVCCLETTQTAVMEPHSGRFRVAFDNGFSGRHLLHELNFHQIR